MQIFAKVRARARAHPHHAAHTQRGAPPPVQTIPQPLRPGCARALSEPALALAKAWPWAGP